jgi:hypothetical protein
MRLSCLLALDLPTGIFRKRRQRDAASNTMSLVSLRSADLHHTVAGCEHQRL